MARRQNKQADDPAAKAYVDRVIEMMKNHGAQPVGSRAAYRRAVAQVSKAFTDLRVPGQ